MSHFTELLQSNYIFLLDVFLLLITEVVISLLVFLKLFGPFQTYIKINTINVIISIGIFFGIFVLMEIFDMPKWSKLLLLYIAIIIEGFLLYFLTAKINYLKILSLLTDTIILYIVMLLIITLTVSFECNIDFLTFTLICIVSCCIAVKLAPNHTDKVLPDNKVLLDIKKTPAEYFAAYGLTILFATYLAYYTKNLIHKKHNHDIVGGLSDLYLGFPKVMRQMFLYDDKKI
jgi:hypothetical protein